MSAAGKLLIFGRCFWRSPLSNATGETGLPETGYDIIGDIHGHSQSLQALLEKLGYQNVGEVYRHPLRKVIFLGDFVDRGDFQREVLDLVRPMIESGAALSVMGNHEFNAIAFFSADSKSGGYLRSHSEKNVEQHQAFLDAYKDSPAEYENTINWFKTLPLWLDLGDLRIIHACWDQSEIDRILEYQNGSHHLSEELLQLSNQKGTWQYTAIETILKGKESALKSGNTQATTYKTAFMGPESARTHIPEDEIAGDHLVEYSHDAPPVFLGHYWMEGVPMPLAPNIACLDYSVAKPGGKLVAYRWDGEQTLGQDRFEWVKRVEA